MIKPTKYISLNILNIWSFFSFLLFCYEYLLVELDLNLPFVHMNFVYYYAITFATATIVLHFLWILEIIIRKTKFCILPEINIPKPFNIIHYIMFYIGWIFALFTIIISSRFLWIFYFTPEGSMYRGIDFNALD